MYNYVFTYIWISKHTEHITNIWHFSPHNFNIKIHFFMMHFIFVCDFICKYLGFCFLLNKSLSVHKNVWKLFEKRVMYILTDKLVYWQLVCINKYIIIKNCHFIIKRILLKCIMEWSVIKKNITYVMVFSKI